MRWWQQRRIIPETQRTLDAGTLIKTPSKAVEPDARREGRVVWSMITFTRTEALLAALVMCLVVTRTTMHNDGSKVEVARQALQGAQRSTDAVAGRLATAIRQLDQMQREINTDAEQLKQDLATARRERAVAQQKLRTTEAALRDQALAAGRLRGAAAVAEAVAPEPGAGKGGATARRKRVLFITLATGRLWASTAMTWIGSAQKHFCAGADDPAVTYLLMTDAPTYRGMQQLQRKAAGGGAGGGAGAAERQRRRHTEQWAAVAADSVWVYDGVVKYGWPTDTLNKFKNLNDADGARWKPMREERREGGGDPAPSSKVFSSAFKDYDFVLMTDADNVFQRGTCEDLLGTRVALQHPQYWDSRANGAGGPRPQCEGKEEKDSRACFKHAQDIGAMFPYYSAHIFGGTAPEFQRLVKTLLAQTEDDNSRHVVATVHDESHLNHYLTLPNNWATVLLSRAFKWPNSRMKDAHDNTILAMAHTVGTPEAKAFVINADKVLEPFVIEPFVDKAGGRADDVTHAEGNKALLWQPNGAR